MTQLKMLSKEEIRSITLVGLCHKYNSKMAPVEIISKLIISRAPTELSSIERSVINKDVTTGHKWSFYKVLKVEILCLIIF